MALDHLLASLERDATAEAAALLTEAKAGVARVTAAAEAHVARRRAETLGVREQELRAAAELAVARARRAARARVLDARARAIARVFAGVQARLPAAAGSAAFHATLPARLAAARACAGDAPVAVRCAPDLAPHMRSALAGAAPAVAVQPDAAIATGFVLATTDGSLEVDETLEARLARRRQELTVDVARELEADQP
jgi:vacuolar-type H+-ATPase subunit E/Vma4